MATKPTKKKAAPAKSSAAVSTPSEAAPKAAPAKAAPSLPTGSAVIPFAPMTAETLRKFTPSTPSFMSSLGSAESIMKNYKEQAEKFSGDATATAREGVESITKYGASLAKGAEQIMKTVAELAKESAARNAECMKTLMACRTMAEFTEAQNKMAKQSFEDAMSSATKLSEMTIKICNEAAEPLNGQMAQAMKKMKSSMAA